MDNVVQLRPKVLRSNIQNEINEGLLGITDYMKHLSKSYTKKDLRDERHFNDRPIQFDWGTTTEERTYKFRSVFRGVLGTYLEWDIRNMGKKNMGHKEYIQPFHIPYKTLKTSYWREKMTLWMLRNTYTEIYGEEVIDNFLSSEDCVFQKSNNLKLYM